MQKLTFITGNQSKADYLARYCGVPIAHRKLELDEIQSLDLREVVAHKVRQAYDIVKQPVLVEDVALEFTAMGRLPGTFIKFFVDELPLQAICDLVSGAADRSATARCMYAIYDGTDITYFEGSLRGLVAQAPDGDGGFGWDKIFIPDGFSRPSACLNAADYETTYRALKPISQLSAFLKES